MQTCNEFLCVYNAFRVYLIDISIEHLSESGCESLLWELEFFILSKDLFHFCDCHATTTFCILFHQDIVQCELIKEHFCYVDLIEEHLVGHLPCLILVQFTH